MPHMSAPIEVPSHAARIASAAPRPRTQSARPEIIVVNNTFMSAMSPSPATNKVASATGNDDPSANPTTPTAHTPVANRAIDSSPSTRRSAGRNSTMTTDPAPKAA